MPLLRSHRRRQRRLSRLLLSLAASFVLVIAAVRFWPLPSAKSDAVEIVYAGDEAVEVEEIQPTRQSRTQAPPPPPPLPPVAVPNDVELEPVDLDLSANLFSSEERGENAPPQEGFGTADAPAPATEARLLRYVEPEYTKAARKKKVRAEIVVEVLVTPEGRVREAQIVRQALLNASGQPGPPVEQIGYGLEEAVLSAAQQWLFRPARAGGEAVPSRKTLPVRFGS